MEFVHLKLNLHGLCKGLSLVAILCLTTNALAEIIYDESIHGDLPGHISALNDIITLEFRAGQNIIRGSAPFAAIQLLENGEYGISDDPADGFRFTVPPGKKIHMVLSEQIFGLLPGETAGWVWELYKEQPSWEACGGDVVAHNHSGHVDANSEIPIKFEDVEIGPGEYCIYYNYRFLETENYEDDGVYMDYVFEVSVTDSMGTIAVPFPSFGLYLLGWMMLLAANYSLSRNR